MENKPNLVFTIALDPPGSTDYRLMARMLVSSLLKTSFTGEILVFRNTGEPLFAPRPGLREIFVEPENLHTFKFRARKWIDGTGYDRIFFLDCDCLVLRNVDHLLEGDWDIAWQPELGKPIQSRVFKRCLTPAEMENLHRDGANGGVWAVRGEHFEGVMAEWERLVALRKGEGRPYEQPEWNRVLLDYPVRKRQLERLEVMFPMYLHPRFGQYRQAAIIHVCGIPTGPKIEFLTALYIQWFHGGEARRIIEEAVN